MYKKHLAIVNNEKIFQEEKNFYCTNLNLKNVPEGLSNYYEVHYITRSSKKKGQQKLNLKNVKSASNIFKFIYFIFSTFKNKEINYLLIGITPYTFSAFLVLFIFRKKIFLYLMSSGYDEFKHLLGRWSVWIYHIMHLIVTSNSEVIVCHDRLSEKKQKHIVYPSRLNSIWFENRKENSIDKVKFLYVGRLSREKGIFEFIKMLNDLNIENKLSIVGEKYNKKITNKNIDFLGYISDPKSLIKIYDSHNITVLPSFTEAHPYVLDESLSRKRPVIIFEDIAYVQKNKKGVFISKRNVNSFLETVNYVINNYQNILQDIENNSLPTEKLMLEKFSNILNSKNN